MGCLLGEEWGAPWVPGWCCLDPPCLEEALWHLAHIWTPTFQDLNWNLYSWGLKFALVVLAAGQWGHEELRLTGTIAPLAQWSNSQWSDSCLRLGWPCGGKELSGRWHRDDGNCSISPFLCSLPHLAGDQTAWEGKDAFGTWCCLQDLLVHFLFPWAQVAQGAGETLKSRGEASHVEGKMQGQIHIEEQDKQGSKMNSNLSFVL